MDESAERKESPRHSAVSSLLTMVAAFGTYFCMYAFRKPFTAGTYEDQELFGLELKVVLVTSQLCGYMLSKFIGVRVISEMPRHRRIVSMLALIGIAELALVGFAFAPVPIKVLMLFFNGLPLGMIFGLVLAYLEGRQHTEALASGLCASFIVSSGVVKSVGQWLVVRCGVSEFQMPFITGLLFLLPLLFFIWLLQRTPEPSAEDRRLRSERLVMKKSHRKEFFRAYRGGLVALLFVYIVLTVMRTMRDDFGVELWQALGVHERPAIYAQSETVIAIVVTALNALAVCIRPNLAAMTITTLLMSLGFAMIGAATFAQWLGAMSAFPFMVICGIGLYIPYVAFHTTVFERLVAASRRPGNLGFLIYLADAIGYLGYWMVMVWKSTGAGAVGNSILPAFRTTALVTSAASIAALMFAIVYFHRVLSLEESEEQLSPATHD